MGTYRCTSTEISPRPGPPASKLSTWNIHYYTGLFHERYKPCYSIEGRTIWPGDTGAYYTGLHWFTLVYTGLHWFTILSFHHNGHIYHPLVSIIMGTYITHHNGLIKHTYNNLCVHYSTSSVIHVHTNLCSGPNNERTPDMRYKLHSWTTCTVLS